MKKLYILLCSCLISTQLFGSESNNLPENFNGLPYKEKREILIKAYPEICTYGVRTKKDMEIYRNKDYFVVQAGLVMVALGGLLTFSEYMNWPNLEPVYTKNPRFFDPRSPKNFRDACAKGLVACGIAGAVTAYLQVLLYKFKDWYWPEEAAKKYVLKWEPIK